MNRRSYLSVFAVLVAAACADTTSPSGSRLAPLLEPTMNLGTELVPNEFIVVLKDGADVASGVSRAQGLGGEVVAEWATALRGYAVRGGPGLINSLRSDPDVQFVEQVQMYSTQGSQTPATWGLDRIDQDDLPLNNTYTYANTGAGVTAYIIDTGIRTTHSEFGGRAAFGANFAGGNNDDCNGHGTHVAGTVGGTTYGVAKGVSLIAVKVLNCAGSGTTTGVVNGINWVANNRVVPAVANMSLGGGASGAIDQAVAGATGQSVTMVVAAGNSSANACNYSPARAPSAITVGATTSTDAKASYSNFGNCVDIFAPGSGITSAWKNSNTATKTISGTSMASPHVAGVAAVYLETHGGDSPSQVATALVSGGIEGTLTSVGTGSPNIMLRQRW